MSKALSREVLEVERLLPEIRATHAAFLKSGKETVELAKQIGDRLWKLKECVKHGEWASVVENRCEFSTRTAQTYMKLSGGWELLEKQEAAATTIDGCVKLIGQAKPKGGDNGNQSRKAPKSAGPSIGTQKTDAPIPATKVVEVEVSPEVPGVTVTERDECPKGGDHARGADGTCDKCLDPPPVKQYADTFDTETFVSSSINLAEKQTPYDEILNAITAITKTWNKLTSDERDGVYVIDKRQRVERILKELRAPIAQARPHALCDHCEGKGCKKCHNCGWWPRSVVEGLKK
jgi:hypothetical protein